MLFKSKDFDENKDLEICLNNKISLCDNNLASKFLAEFLVSK